MAPMPKYQEDDSMLLSCAQYAHTMVQPIRLPKSQCPVFLRQLVARASVQKWLCENAEPKKSKSGRLQSDPRCKSLLC